MITFDCLNGEYDVIPISNKKHYRVHDVVDHELKAKKNRITLWYWRIRCHFGHVFVLPWKKRRENKVSVFVSFEPYLHLKIMRQYDDGAVTFTFIFNQFQWTNWWLWVSWLLFCSFIFHHFDEHIHPFMSAQQYEAANQLTINSKLILSEKMQKKQKQ